MLAARGRSVLRGAISWLGYLSTVGVYGDFGGDWVDEDDPDPPPNSERSRARMEAERAWLALRRDRLAGADLPPRRHLRAGPQRLRQAAAGTARRIVKPGQVFNRIHVDDIAGVLQASIARPRAGAIYNVSDDEPAPPQEVVDYAAELLGVPLPPAIPFDEAELTPMARSFYADSRRVSNARIK